MLSRENRVFVLSWLLLGAFILGSAVTGVGQNAVVWFLALVGLGFLAPQLYLAVVDASVPARTRIRVAALTTVVIALFAYDAVGGTEAVAIAVVAGIVLGALLGYEFTAGYRDVRHSS